MSGNGSSGRRVRARVGHFVIASVLATSVIAASAALAQPRFPGSAPTAPKVVPSVPNAVPTTIPPPPPSGPVAMPRNPVAPGTIMKANAFQTRKPLIAPARPTPAVAMVVARQAKHAAFDERSTLRPVPRRGGAISPPALPATLGAGGPPLKVGPQVVVDTDGRRVPTQVYQVDTYTLEDYLNGRGITQRTKEGTGRKTRDIKRQVPRAQLPAADATTLRPGNLPTPRGKPPVLPIARAQTLSQASAALWESGDSVTLDEYPSKDEKRKPQPMKQQPPPPPPEEIDRPDATTTWYYKSGGEVGLDIDADGTFAAGRTRRKARATMGIRGYAAGIDFPLFSIDGEIVSTVEHTFDKSSKTFGKGGGPAPNGSGSLTIMGIGAPAFPKYSGLKSPDSWRKGDSWSISAAVPVGPFLAEFGFSMAYEVNGLSSLTVASDGLGVTAQVGPEFGAYAELTAGIGMVGFSIGVGGHVALLGNKDASGPASFTRRASSTYDEGGFKQHLNAGIDSNVWALSGYLFAFIDTWWDRYDTEIFDWDGIKLGDGDVASGETDIVWGTFQEPDYGTLKDFRAFACRTKTAKGVGNFPHDWVVTTRTKAELTAGGCELASFAGNDVYLGKLASKWNPDTIPVAECKAETAWLEPKYGNGAVLVNVPLGTGMPYVTNEYVKALWKDWKTAPSDAEVTAEAKAECENVRVGSGQRLTFVRLAGYAWKTKGNVLLNWKTKQSTSTIEVHRCTGNGYDWWLQTNKAVCPGGYPNGPSNFYIAN